MLSEREQIIFTRGIAVGMRAAKEFDAEFKEEEAPKAKRKYKTKKKKKYTKKERSERAKAMWAARKAKKEGKYEGLANLGQETE